MTTSRLRRLSLFILSTAAFLIFSSAEAQQCRDGFDNDGDGRTDALIELSPWNGESIHVGGTGNQARVAAAVRDNIIAKRLPFTIPISARGSGILRADVSSRGNNTDEGGTLSLPTLQAVCFVLGYRTYVNSTCNDRESSGKCNFYSPGNNDMWRFVSGNFRAEGAPYKTWIATIDCRDRLPACNDGWDNDGDGLVDRADDGCASDNDDSEAPHDPQCGGNPVGPRESAECADGIDNDGDGAIDLNDFSCSDATDTDETNPRSQCQDGSDNDGDGLVDTADPGCSSNQDNNEGDGTSQCQDGIDNDSDGATDFPADFSCSSPQDTDETNPRSQCQDGVDNDGDGLTDLADPGCRTAQDNNEGAATSQCQDGIDNDGDGAADFPADFSCSSLTDNNEQDPRSQCQDGVDNDGDGATDFPADVSCSSAQDNDELLPRTECQDGVDNDGDAATDLEDPGCSGPQDTTEAGEAAGLTVGVECVMNNADGSKVAYFSYNNPTSYPITLGLGRTGTPLQVNELIPFGPDRGQPTVFLPGVQKGVAAVYLEGSAPVTWRVRGPGTSVSVAVASDTSPRCGQIVPMVDCRGYDGGALKVRGGYLNPNPFSVYIPYGELNGFDPGYDGRGQPEIFFGGFNPGRFSFEISETEIGLQWRLNGASVDIRKDLVVCDGQCVDSPVGAIRDSVNETFVQLANLTKEAAAILAAAPDRAPSTQDATAGGERRVTLLERARVDAERARARADEYVAQAQILTIQFPDVVKNCPDAPLYCSTVNRGPTIDALRALFSAARNTAQRTIARAYFLSTGTTNRRDALVARARELERRGLEDLDVLPRTETECR